MTQVVVVAISKTFTHLHVNSDTGRFEFHVGIPPVQNTYETPDDHTLIHTTMTAPDSGHINVVSVHYRVVTAYVLQTYYT